MMARKFWHGAWAPWMSLGVAAVIAGMVFAAACGGDDGNDDNDDDGGGATPAAASAGDLSIFEPWVRTTTNDVSAGYLRVENAGPDDTLVSAKTNVSQMVQLHEVVTEGATSKMQPKEGGFPVPAQGALELKPGGFHIMLMNLAEPLVEGDSVELELTFEKAGTIKLTAPVRPAAGMGGMESGGH